MYNIFFGNRRLSVSSNRDPLLKNPNAVLYSPGSLPQLTALPQLFWNSTEIDTLLIPSDNVENTFKQLVTNLYRINAGGGLVSNRRGDILLIHRYGKWDLPKGTQEPSEDIRNSALREVSEECGLTMEHLEIKEHICDTYHTFERDGRFNLKYTKWYRMEFLGDDSTTLPQALENIEQAVWVEPAQLHLYLNNTYLSILEVFEKSWLQYNLEAGN